MNKSLKNIFRLITLTILSFYTLVQTTPQATSYILKLRLPPQVATSSGLKAYYKGYQIDLSEQWAILPECETPLTFSILITENVDVKGKKNTVRCLQRIEGLASKWYDLTLSLESIPGSLNTTHNWHVEELVQEEIPVRIPENTIIILTDPEFVKSLDVEPAITSNTNINLPTIVFKSDIDKNEFKESLVTTIMATLNLDAIHKKDRPLCKKRHDAAIISSATKQ